MTRSRVNAIRRSEARRRWPNRLALVLAFVAILLLVRWVMQSHHQTPPPIPAEPPTSSPLAVKFDFYKVLPGMAVPASPVSTAAPSVYILQIGIVNTLGDAESLRKQMHSVGYNAFIQSSRSDQGLEYRVLLGPFPSQELAQKHQTKLRDHHIHSTILRTQ